MLTKQMVPPEDGSRNSVTFNGRTYSSSPGVGIAVPTFDVPVLEANKWTVSGETGTAGAGEETVYGKLRRLARRGRLNNPRALPALAGSVRWVTGTAYPAGAEVSNAGNVYKTVTGGTSGATPPVHISGSVSDGAVTWHYQGPQSAPAVTINNSVLTGTYPTVVDYWGSQGGVPNAKLFGLYGGTPVVEQTNFLQLYNTTIFGSGSGNVESNPARSNCGWKLDFMVNCNDFVIRVLGNANPSFNYRIAVDGRYIVPTGFQIGTGGTWNIILDWTNAGGRKSRLITIEFENAASFRGVLLKTTDKISLAKKDETLAIAIAGDSYAAGGNATRQWDSFANVLGDYFGATHNYISGVGGTGYLSTNPVGGISTGAAQAYTLRQRISDVTGPSPEMIFIFLGINDRAKGYSDSAVASEVPLVIESIRAVLPKVPIFVFGGHKGGQTVAEMAAFENTALKAPIDALRLTDPNLFFLPICSHTNPWITGTGKIGATVGDGNADVFLDGDGVHPVTAGHEYIAARAWDAVMEAIADRP